MLKALLRDLRARRGRTMTTIGSATIGVAFVVASLVVGDSRPDPRAGTGIDAERAADAASTQRLAMLIFAALAVVVAGFVAGNTFGMLLTQRRRHFALLRSIGASRGQLRRTLLAEAAIVGAAGAVLGTLVGIPVAFAALVWAAGRQRSWSPRSRSPSAAAPASS